MELIDTGVVQIVYSLAGGHPGASFEDTFRIIIILGIGKVILILLPSLLALQLSRRNEYIGSALRVTFFLLCGQATGIGILARILVCRDDFSICVAHFILRKNTQCKTAQEVLPDD